MKTQIKLTFTYLQQSKENFTQSGSYEVADGELNLTTPYPDSMKKQNMLELISVDEEYSKSHKKILEALSIKLH